jgi:uncharacterized cupredoxin-like copper-binding protein
MHRRHHLLGLGLGLLLSAPAIALAHGEPHARGDQPVKKEQKPWGIAGDAKAVRRTVTLRMGDDMRFSPAHLEVRQGDTLRLMVHNAGKRLHELVIGTRQELDEHALLMHRFPNMEHDAPYMAHVEPGKISEIIWTFNRAGDFEYACLIAGHFQAGMRGTLRVTPR